MLVGHRPVVHLATGTVVGWRLGRTRIPTDDGERSEHLRAAVCEMCDTLRATDRGQPSMRFAVIEASIGEAPVLVEHVEWALAEYGMPGARLGVVFPGEQVVARPELHPSLRRLVDLGLGVGFDDPQLTHSNAALRAGLPVTRLRLRLPLSPSGVDHAVAARFDELVNLARRAGVRTSVTGIDTSAQERIARRAGADVGTGDQLGAVHEVPVLDVRSGGGTMEAVQRLTNAFGGVREHAWAIAGG